MSILSRIKGTLGIKKAAKSSASNASSGRPIAFDVVFEEQSLGVTLCARPEDNRTEITDVREGSAASAAGVQVGDVISHIDGNPVNSFDEFDAICGALSRPLTLR
jgi:S1-C subfamily serine protease